MQKRRWAIIAGVCMLALIVMGAVFIPRILNSSRVEDSTEIIVPGQWWQKNLSEEQLKTLESLWGSETTIEAFVRGLWPDVIRELPAEMVVIWAQNTVFWPMGKFEDWERSPSPDMCFGLTTMGPEGAMMCFDVYLGSKEMEETTFRRNKDYGLVEDTCYRVSMYT